MTNGARSAEACVQQAQIAGEVQMTFSNLSIALPQEDFARHIRTDIERWSRVIRESGVRAE